MKSLPSMFSSLHTSLQGILNARTSTVPFPTLTDALPTSAPDLFSNDYLSIANNGQLRQSFLKRIAHSSHLFGSRGSRMLAGNTSEHIALESRLQQYFGTEAVMLFNSGYDANVSFFGSIPQEGDAVLFDELIHASCHDGLAVSRARKAARPFAHNSVISFEMVLRQVLAGCPQIVARKATLFVVVESLYSMDGDFCPLPDFLRVLDRYVPSGCYHVVVDEAHSTGILGPGGRGFVAELGLQDRVHTVIHTFGKARGLTGAVITTSPIVRRFLIHYARPLIFSTSLPHMNLIALQCSCDIIEGPLGDQLRTRLQELSAHFGGLLLELVKTVPKTAFSLPETANQLIPFSPIFPILTPQPVALATYLEKHGYGATAIAFPAVPRGQERIRVVIHAGNAESDLDNFVALLRHWAMAQHASGWSARL
ncbi:aminotransferase [Artomyces pyxidatus]|uniref:Aminotransferase n=1 Tax=Artomyces pyxidatus TaxID=48021 RepID=A0ACB8SV22_9AGAM|nr:aminotransferase [Artomyces pyxidatus]